jgi:hypothetical protein
MKYLIIIISTLSILYVITYTICSFFGSYSNAFISESGLSQINVLGKGPEVPFQDGEKVYESVIWMPKYFPYKPNSFVWYFYYPAVYIDVKMIHNDPPIKYW